jgi:hypothetical protein
MIGVREADGDEKGLIRCVFNRPLHGLPLEVTADPSDKSLGYYQPSANAD